MLQTSKVEENPPELQRKISVGDANIPNREKSFPFICHWDYPLRLNRHTLFPVDLQEIGLVSRLDIVLFAYHVCGHRGIPLNILPGFAANSEEIKGG